MFALTKRKLLLMLCCMLWLPAATFASADSLRVSLLTCSPGQEAYDLYGHTAVCVEDLSKRTAKVYNYGVFDFNAPHFVWRFVLGETDYSLGVLPASFFVNYYLSVGRSVDVQELSLTPEEAARASDALERNAQQAGWTYRYNFLRDNCTTRAVAMVEQALDGELKLPERPEATYRSLLGRYVAASRWVEQGDNLLLGAEADNEIDSRGQLFLPLEARDIVAASTVRSADGSERPLVSTTRTITPQWPLVPAETPALLSPMALALLLLAAVTLVSLFDVRRKRPSWAVDAALLAVQGAVGCLIAFMVLFSKHPAVGSNWLAVWLNPLPLVAICFVLKRERAGRWHGYFGLNALLVALGILCATFAGQQLPLLALVLAYSLILRAFVVWKTLAKPARIPQHNSAK